MDQKVVKWRHHIAIRELRETISRSKLKI